MFNTCAHQAVVTGNNFPGMSGEQLAHSIKRQPPSTTVLLHSEAAPEDSSCFDAVIPLPAHLLHLAETIARILTPRLEKPSDTLTIILGLGTMSD